MSVIRLPIDTKSLYCNIKNDNQTGHTATVSTPLRQGASVHEELSLIRTIPQSLESSSKENIISMLLSKSRTKARITDVFVFSNISVNGIEISCDSSFCVYIREETDENSIHFGRQKVHYPQSLVYSDLSTNIDNKKILNCISMTLHNYAFIIEAFEYNFETQFLNFDAIIVGNNSIPYSRVFVNKRGVGGKLSPLFSEYSDVYDTEIIALRDHLGYSMVGPDNYLEIVKHNKLLALDIVKHEIGESDGVIRVLSIDYPSALYDIEYSVMGKKKYIIVCHTATKVRYFSLTHSKIRFCHDFADDTCIALVTDINGVPKINWFSIDEIDSMSKSISSITYEKRED